MELTSILRKAFSGELAAAYAYRGQWRSLNRGGDQDRVRAIEEEEWHHRRLVGAMLSQLGASASRWRESRSWLFGRTIGASCHVTGWLISMYGAGRLESGNIAEYETAARLAWQCGRQEWVECLLTMAEVEWDHEAFFRARVLSHRWGSKLPLWNAPAPRENIRESFDRECEPAVPSRVLA